MLIYRLAQYLDTKYQLHIIAAAPVPEQVKKIFKVFRDTWLDGPRVKDQTILLWADEHNEDVQFELIRELLQIVTSLSINPMLDVTTAYRDVQRALSLSQMLKDQAVSEIESMVELQFKGRLTEIIKNKLKHQGSKVRTFLRMLDSAYSKARNELGRLVDAKEKAVIDAESMGGYEEQKAKSLSKKTLESFTFHPEASKYGLNSKEFLAYLFSMTMLKPLLERLIRAVKRGHTPKDAPAVLSTQDSFEDLKKKLETNLALLEGGDEAEQARQQIVSPEEAWNARMQGAKQEKSVETQEEEAAQAEKAKLAPLLQKRDEEFKQKQIEEDRARHIRSDASNSWVNQLSKRYL